MAGERVKCKFCGEIFNANKEPSVHIGNRYAHKACYEKECDSAAVANEQPEASAAKKVLKKNLRKCIYCKKEFDITDGYRMPRQNAYAHIECYEKNYSPDEEFVSKIYSYLKSVGINYDYNQCDRQRNYFISKLGYTNEGIYNALRYFYGVKKGSPEKSGNRIGIVSYVYNEAKEYYTILNKQQKEIEKKFEKQIENQKELPKINKPKRKKKERFIEFDDEEGNN